MDDTRRVCSSPGSFVEFPSTPANLLIITRLFRDREELFVCFFFLGNKGWMIKMILEAY